MKSSIVFILLFISTQAFSQIVNPRAWAEFEETQGIIINPENSWRNVSPGAPQFVIDMAVETDSLSTVLINEALSQDIDIYYLFDIVNTSFDFDTALVDTLQNRYGINTAHPNFHKVRYERTEEISPDRWVRDHGPMNVYKNMVDTLYTVMFDGDVTGLLVSEYLGLPHIQTTDGSDLSSDGGNYMVNGSTSAIIDGGGSVLPNYASMFGLTDILEVPPYLVHADYYMKLVNEETLLISWTRPENYTTGYEIHTYEQDTTFLYNVITFIQSNAVAQTGRPYEIIKIPTAPSFNSVDLNLTYFTNEASYTNSLIVNDAVFVPQYHNPATDTVAINVYEQTMPGYRIIPLPCREPAQSQGAIHCLTNSIATDEPILIQHAWLPDSVNQTTDYEIAANILTRSGINAATLYWTTDLGMPYQSIPMVNTADDIYTASIPGQAYGTRVHYYIEAEANSGKTGNKPLVAPVWAYNFLVHQDGVVSGTAEYLNDKSLIKVFPNPTTDVINFDLSNFSDGSCEIILFDVWGKRVAREVTRSFNKSIDVSRLDKGAYFYTIDNLQTGKFISGQFIRQ